MAEEKTPKTKVQSKQLSNSNTPDEEADLRLCTSEEERNHGTIRGSMQATQAALSHSRAQTNLTVERLTIQDLMDLLREWLELLRS